jgi:heptaprenyl diphosphate synthase
MTASITDRRLAAFAALAVSVHLLEAGIPSPVPGIKPGLANVVTLLVLWRYGFAAAAWVTLLRVVASGMLLGTLFGPTFILSLAGASGALLVLVVMHRMDRGVFGPVGYAVPAAIAHILAQLAVAGWLFVPHPGLWRIAPVLLLLAIATGITSGIITAAINARLPARPDAR